MSELKTLKDLISGCDRYPNCNKICGQVFLNDIRTEAIKWVKHLKMLGRDSKDFIDFFNITDDEV